ncbi:MAG: hypothetical protein IT462_15990 [Planctomycetes bacterium]|nr:hypothetical protein [Planctomycetota bacterium]
MARVIPYFIFAAFCVLAASLLPAPVARAQAAASDAAREAGIRLLGAARGYATAALWLRAEDAYARSDLHETRAMHQVIRELQPRNPAVYGFQAWNEGYNLAAQFPEPERRAEWVIRGLNTLHTGQRLIPNEASLRLDEWHYLLGRTQSFPVEILREQAKSYGGQDRTWAVIVETICKLEAGLAVAERAKLREFVEEVGLRPEFAIDFDELKAFVPVYKPGEDRPESVEVPEFTALPENARRALALANWARWHCMLMVLEPVIHLRVRSSSTDKALMLSYYVAQKTLPPGGDKYAEEYRAGARKAYAAGVENARRMGGDKSVAEFIDVQQTNFADLPGWLE